MRDCFFQKNIIELFYAPVAQSVEHLPFKQRVVGSIPSRRTRQEKSKSFGSSRGVYPASGGTRRLIGIQF